MRLSWMRSGRESGEKVAVGSKKGIRRSESVQMREQGTGRLLTSGVSLDQELGRSIGCREDDVMDDGNDFSWNRRS